MKLLSLFSGIGAYEKALDQCHFSFELEGFSEIDKFAIKSYCAIHNVPPSLNFGDISQIKLDKLSEVDLVTYSFPCTDISIAGEKNGFFNADGTPTRSGLFFDALAIINKCRPKVAIAENVKNLVANTFKKEFGMVLDGLDKAGYNTYWKVMNAADYGMPQSRQRVFIVSIRKDIDKGFKFPEPCKLEIKFGDLIEAKVDSKYYLSDKMLAYLERASEENKARGNNNVFKPADLDGVAHIITTRAGGRVIDNFVEGDNGRLRKLTPKECFRLMGFSDSDADAAAKVCSDTQLYKQCGNSVVVNCLAAIFKNLESYLV